MAEDPKRVQLHAEAERAQQYLDLAEVMFVAIDANELVTLANRKACSVLECGEAEVLGQNWFDTFLPAPQREAVRAVFRQLMRDEIAPAVRFVNPVVTRSGRERTIAWHNTVVRDSAGRVTGTLSSGEDITERRQAEEELRRERDFANKAIDSLPGIFYVFDENGRFRRWNKNYLAVTGLTPADMERIDPLHVIHEDDRAEIRGRLQRRFEEGGYGDPGGTPFRVRSKDGTFLHYSGTGVRLDFDGRTHIIGTAVDVTARKQAEEALLDSEATYRSLVETSPDGIVLIDLEGTIIKANQWTARLHGFDDAAELVGRSALSLIAAADRERAAGDLARTLATGTRGVRDERYALLRRDGSSFPAEVSTSVVTDDQGDASAVVGVMRDISARQRREDALRATEERFRTVFQSVRDGILVADLTTGRFVMANERMGEMLGCPVEDVVRMGFPDIHPVDALERVTVAIQRQVEEEQSLATDIPVKRRDGSVFFADVNAAPIEIQGQPLLMGCFRDVTELRQMRSHVAQQDRLASVGLLAAGVAHEINNPLTYVLHNIEGMVDTLPRLTGALARLQDALGPQEMARILGPDASLAEAQSLTDLPDQAKEAIQGALRVRDIVRDLSTFSRVEDRRTAPVALNAVITGALSMAANQIKYRAQLRHDLGELPTLMANDGRLSQVFLNLLVNAAHAIEEGDVEHNEICVRTWAQEDEVLVEIKDTGRGIAEADLARVFDPFFSTKESGKGSGLGLSICRNIIDAYGGQIDVESSVGKGTRFIVHLPITPTAPGEPPADPDESAAERADPRGRVLIIDDEPLVAAALQRMLAGEHQVEVASSGAAAQKLLERDPRFDAIVCDLMMPDMTGMDLHEWLEPRHAVLADAMIFITGGTFTPRAKDFLERVNNPVLEKPFDRRALRAVLHERMRSARQG